MELVSSKININFMKLRYVFALLSVLVIAASVFIWVDKGDAKYGVDFLGGTELVVSFAEPVAIQDLRQTLGSAGFEGAVVQAFEGENNDEYSIRLKSNRDAETASRLKQALRDSEMGAFEVLKEDFVGPIIGDQIRKDGLTAMAIALVCILIYITARFEWRFALGAIFALVHDVLITTGLFVWSGREISAAVLAALLTIIGYSLNDTIIVFDRIRENLAARLKSGSERSKKATKTLPFLQLVNLSINQTLSRTVLTSLTTLFVVLSLWLLGGGAVADLAFALVIGVVVGTYSSIFIACAAVVALDKYGEKRQ